MIDQRRLLGMVSVLSILTVSVDSGLARPQPAAGEPHGFLRSVAGFTSAELGRLDRGEPIAKVLETDRREVAIVGAVRVAGSQAKLFERYRNISTLKTSDVVMEIGRFSTPPAPEDLRELHFEDYDLERSEERRVGKEC